MTILDKIDRSICLTLDKRYEMATELKTSLAGKKIDVELFVVGSGARSLKYDFIDQDQLPPMHPDYSTKYPTWSARPNAYNAWLSHREIFLRCKDDENLLLLEDDSVISEDFDEMVEKVSPFFYTNKWDMIYFGCYHHLSLDTSDPNVKKMNGGGGFHGVLMTPKVRKILLNYPPYGPYDWLMGWNHQYLNCYAIYPGIINQKSGYSYVEGSNLEKPPRDKL